MARSTHKADLAAELRRRISDEELVFTFTPSRGPGGQNVNKVSTKAVLTFDLRSTTTLSPEEKRRICEKLAGRISRQGILSVAAMRHRTQRANRLAAAERLFELLAGALHRPRRRVATKISRGAKIRRVDEKRRAGARKRMRESRGRGLDD